jgi:hypothetical protein
VSATSPDNKTFTSSSNGVESTPVAVNSTPATKAPVSRTTSATASQNEQLQQQQHPIKSALKSSQHNSGVATNPAIPSKLEQQFKPVDDLHLINLKLNHIEINVSLF